VSEIVERFLQVRRDGPHRRLVHLPSHRASLTADDLWTSSLAQRALLQSHGLGADQLVIAATGNRPSTLALWLACRALGIAMMPLDSGTPVAEIGSLARRFGAIVAIVPPSVPGLADLGAPEPFGHDALAVRVPNVDPKPELYRGAAVLKITSGSSGPVKATFTTESQLVCDTTHICAAMDIGSGDTQIAAIPLSHAYGIGNLVLPVLLQGTAIVMRDSFVPPQLPADAAEHRARVLPGVPFMFDHLAAAIGPGGWPPCLELLISAGARLESPTIGAFKRAFGLKIHSFYGTSETGGISFDGSPDIEEEATLGRALPGVTITLRPEDGAPADGGRIHVASDAVASGYAGGEAGDGAFVQCGFLTGDFGRFDARGHLILTGRASSFINVAGRKVQPEEVEQVLRAMPGIEDVRVIGAPDATRGEQIVACIVSHSPACSPLAIRQFCAARLAPHKIPRSIVRLERIPLTARGKTDRRALERVVQTSVGRMPANGVL
jgi:acyl-CoA synthetase (AMP-forming)/AMP-acid ligase II